MYRGKILKYKVKFLQNYSFSLKIKAQQTEVRRKVHIVVDVEYRNKAASKMGYPSLLLQDSICFGVNAHVSPVYYDCDWNLP